MVTASFGTPARRGRRVRAFLTLVLQRLARGRVGERLLQLGPRLLTNVSVLDRHNRLRDRGLESGEVGGEPGGLLEELTRGGVRDFLRTLLERVEAGLELSRRRVELFAELVTRIRVRPSGSTQLAASCVVASSASPSFSRSRTRVSCCPPTPASEFIDWPQSVRLVQIEFAHSSVVGWSPSSLQPHRDRRNDDGDDADDDRRDEPVPTHSRRV